MKGKYRIIIQNNRLRYDFEIRRNITIVRGNSATGKTQLIELIRSYEMNGESSGIKMQCEKNCVVLEGLQWANRLTNIQDSIVFIDEGNRFTETKEFAEAIRHSSNYYVIVTRDRLPTLPYSVEEIYGIRESGKYKGLKQTYNEFFHLYGDVGVLTDVTSTAKTVITEDSNAGHEFWTEAVNGDISCLSSGGKSNIPALIQEINDTILIIADGAAFGSEMDLMEKWVLAGKRICLFLPESFEWIILNADVLKDSGVGKILEAPEEFIESSEYFSWEQFFTKLLVEKSKGGYLRYSKGKLNTAYLEPSTFQKIRNSLPLLIQHLLEI